MSYDIERGIARFLQIEKSYYLDRDGIVKPEPTLELVIENNPWVHFGKSKGMPCRIRHALYHNAFGIIQEYCVKNCWKTVIKPLTLSDLFKVNDYLKETDITSKCGLDLRHFSFGPYLGVIYAETHQDGKENEQIAKDAFPEFDVFLKKGCTEFENRLSSKFWNVTEEQKELEEKLRERIDHSWPEYFKLPDWFIDKTKIFWTQMAYSIGDKTWEESPYAHKIQTSRKPQRY